MIKAVIELVPNSRTSKHGALWAASCDDIEKTFRVVSRTGASHKLARALVAAGYPDQPMEIFWQNRLGLRVKSLHWWARRTLDENPSSPIHQVNWKSQPWKRKPHV